MPIFDTTDPADSLEFCPYTYAQSIFVCGTYKLEEMSESILPSQPQQRRGKCLVLEAVANGPETTIQQLQEISLPAVLDMKWCHRSVSVNPLLGIADSEGNITLHELREDVESAAQLQIYFVYPSIGRIVEHPQRQDDLSKTEPIDSNIPITFRNLGSLVVSQSNGSLCLLQSINQSAMKVTDSWNAHEYEAWIAAWNYWDNNVIYSGGDDSKMKGWDVREGFSRPLFENKRLHWSRFEAGVTSIQSHPHVEHILAVGSYDNTVCIFDTRKPLFPLSQIDVGGGVWRVKWHPSLSRKSDLLVACMHDGFKVCRSKGMLDKQSGQQSSWEVVTRYDAHQSLAYGVDWSFDTSGGETLIASCSFYDHAVRLWTA